MIRGLVVVTLCVAGALPAAAAHLHDTDAGDKVPLFDNLGTHHHKITTKVPLAQRYFDQGLRLVYAFNHDEAVRAFEEAARLDPNCAMAYWGIGLALGPNYNLPLDPERNPAAYAATQKAVQLAPKASAAERAYIAALAQRYSLAPDANRKALDQAYADAMRGVARTYPDDADAATLFAEALMDLRPWALWTVDGQPQPGTLEIVATLEAVLKKAPLHPGANHYYIHAIEPSPHPERGLAAAERLKNLVPGAGHLVHMPSHIYMRTGRYADAADANMRAIKADEAYIAAEKPAGVYPMMYYPHNIHFFWAAASMEGRSADAIRAAREVTNGVSPEMVEEMDAMEYFVPTAVFALARFGKWQDILREPAPPADQAYATGIWHYARGLAFAATGRLDEAAGEQRAVAAAAAAMPPARIIGDNTPPAALLHIAAAALAGEIAARRGQTGEAVKHLQEAVRAQDALPYSEPPPWYYPTRQSLGAVLLAAGRTADAEAVYRDDLQRNPENGWSLYGLWQALRARKAEAEAAAIEKRFRKAWARADVTLTASRF
jgi:tetratricopeptide (TPR) repeat protein